VEWWKSKERVGIDPIPLENFYTLVTLVGGREALFAIQWRRVRAKKQKHHIHAGAHAAIHAANTASRDNRCMRTTLIAGDFRRVKNAGTLSCRQLSESTTASREECAAVTGP
jgi:hypothetical protein